jgi:F0F1-type ATP synthase delta subunit
MINQKAGEIYKLSKETTNTAALILSIMAIVKDSSVEDILEKYNQILEGKLKVAEVVTIKPLTPEQKKKLEYYVSTLIKETPVFLYSEDSGILGGFIVKINDDIIDESILRKILELSVN